MSPYVKWTREEAIKAITSSVERHAGSAQAYAWCHARGEATRMIVPVIPSLFDYRAYANDVADAIAALPFVRSAEWSWVLGDDVPSPELSKSGSDKRPGFVVMIEPVES